MLQWLTAGDRPATTRASAEAGRDVPVDCSPRPDGRHRTGHHHVRMEHQHDAEQHPGWPEQHGPPRESTTAGYAAAGEASSRTSRRTGPARTRPSPRSWRLTTSATPAPLRRHAATCYIANLGPTTRPAARSTERTGSTPTMPGTYENIGYGLNRSLEGRLPVYQQRPSGRLQHDHVRRIGPLRHQPDQRHRVRQARHLRGQQAAPVLSSSFTGLLQLPVNQDQFSQ